MFSPASPINDIPCRIDRYCPQASSRSGYTLAWNLPIEYVPGEVFIAKVDLGNQSTPFLLPAHPSA